MIERHWYRVKDIWDVCFVAEFQFIDTFGNWHFRRGEFDLRIHRKAVCEVVQVQTPASLATGKGLCAPLPGSGWRDDLAEVESIVL